MAVELSLFFMFEQCFILEMLNYGTKLALGTLGVLQKVVKSTPGKSGRTTTVHLFVVLQLVHFTNNTK